MPATMGRNAEEKYRTSSAAKSRTAEICPQWGLSPSDNTGTFLAESIRVGSLPLGMGPEGPTHEDIAVFVYKAPLSSDGIAVLPADWDDRDE